MRQALPLRVRAMTPLVWLLGAACPPNGTTTATEGPGPSPTTGDSGTTANHSGASMGGPTGDPPDTTGDSDGTCEPTAGEPVCSAIPVTPGGDLGCGGEELTISGCDQLAGYELCPNLAVHRHTASIPCDDSQLCDPRFSCSTDEECGPGEACVCDVTWGEDHPTPGPFSRYTSCVSAQCRTDADCAFGMRCGVDTHCRDVQGLYCHTPEDGCEGDADCPERCGYSPEEKRWFCMGHVFCE